MTGLGGGAERLHDLLIKRALWGIDTGESRELQRLAVQYPNEELDAVDRTVAMLDAIELGPSPGLPAGLRAVIERDSHTAGAEPAAPGSTSAGKADASRLPWWIAGALAVVAAAGWMRPCAADPTDIDAATTAQPASEVIARHG